MVFNDITCNILCDIELIIRSYIGDDIENRSKLYRCNIKTEEDIRSIKYERIYVPLSIGEALIEVMDYLESVYSINFAEMPIMVNYKDFLKDDDYM